MGTHSSSPSVVKDSGDLLSDHLREHQDLIGSQIIDKFEDAKNGNLPFLFKVLSIAKALSIQSHPDKETAKQLHAISPKIYKDPNHKPEMALALTDFEALCGFRPLETQDTPKEKVALKNLFAAVMTTPTEKVHSAVEAIVQRYQREQIPDEKLHSLILRLHSQFPHDIGILCPYLLNILHLKPGEAIFLGAGEPHAYISGEAIECMANSDNVIRAGLTPKLRDVPNLVLGLTYETGEGTRHHVSPDAFSTEEQEGAQSLLYDPPIEEFSVLRLDIPKGTSAAQRAVAGPSLAIVTAGEGTLAGDDERGLRVGLCSLVRIPTPSFIVPRQATEPTKGPPPTEALYTT
ncbi:hypothetical protein D9611_015084 [Ephemerocybe angulata]|uniref:Mannose-6-phosphate isomerase n=1 Tax=Ephemerocybe angulata TaxID=980116 RepID=A0A8H5C9J9_9AGAR|nr:hypothetical protein D9611_015084 [Tulosesus angulatus]